MNPAGKNTASADLLECDIVMKGGVTSGIVYPTAVYEISRTYRFRNIGGTSAGAIAASVTAAAEYARRHDPDPDAGFKKLLALPQWLRNDHHLENLFQANDATAPLFEVLKAAVMARGGYTNRIRRAVMSASYRKYPVAAAVIGGAAAAFLAATTSAHVSIWHITATATGCGALFILALATGVGLAGWHAIRDLISILPANHYGFCNGMPPASSQSAALTPWLADLIDDVAGKAPATPLTFADLWGAQSGARDINLEMVTTNITYGRPYSLPLEDAINAFYFNDAEFLRLFPKRIVDWMKSHPRPLSGSDPARQAQSQQRRAYLASQSYYPLPAPADLPVIVAARLSLSFPILLSAIPLHAIDWNKSPDAQKPQMVPCWFSDGGLSSNFPIQFFDAPLPTRPTFAINLRSFPDGQVESNNEADNVWMPATNEEFLTPSRNGVATLPAFLLAIFDTMQNWHDNLQSAVPGFRDRIAHVFLNDHEGGLNLDMPQRVLDRLADRGGRAGDLIVKRFTSESPTHPPQTINWDGHRWTRYRSTMRMLEKFLVDLSASFITSPKSGTDYSALLSRPLHDAPFNYAWNNPNQQAFAQNASANVLACTSSLGKADPLNFGYGAPKPPPELQVRPRI